MKTLLPFATALSILLMACGGASQAAPASQPPASLKAAYATASAPSSPVFVAAGAGLFKKYNLDVELQFLSPVSEVAAMLSGNIDFGYGSPASMATAIVQGGDLVIVGATHDGATTSLVARAGIDKFEDLKGKTIASTQRGSTPDVIVHNLMQKSGMGPNDINMVYIPEPPAQVAALASGAADAIMVSDPALSAALLAGGHAIYGPGSPVPSDYPSATAIAVKRSYLASNRDVVKRFLMANMESIHILKTNPDEAAKYTQSYLKVDDTKVLRQAMTDVANISPDDLIVSDRTLQIVLDATAETDPKVANVKPGDITDFSVIDEIKASHFLDTLK